MSSKDRDSLAYVRFEPHHNPFCDLPGGFWRRLEWACIRLMIAAGEAQFNPNYMPYSKFYRLVRFVEDEVSETLGSVRGR